MLTSLYFTEKLNSKTALLKHHLRKPSVHATTNNPIDLSANGPLPSACFRDDISTGSGCGRAEHQREQLDYHNQKSSCSERVFYRRRDAGKCGSIHSVCLDGSHT